MVGEPHFLDYRFPQGGIGWGSMRIPDRYNPPGITKKEKTYGVEPIGCTVIFGTNPKII